MEILIMDFRGKFAHFRKYYANNTAFTFSIPPRTAIMGMIAALMGRSKDSYYEALSSKNIRIGISAQSDIKKSFHRLNFLKIKGVSDFRGKEGRIQTPFEVISGLDIRSDWVEYRIFISAYESGGETFSELKEVLSKRHKCYNLSFGIASFSAHLENIHLIKKTEIQVLHSQDTVYMHSALVSDKVKLDASKLGLELMKIEEETLPSDFVANGNRELSQVHRVLFSTGGIAIPVRTEAPFYQIRTDREISNIQFIED